MSYDRISILSSIAVAVSGGSDSIALIHLCRHAFEKVLAITVDHR